VINSLYELRVCQHVKDLYQVLQGAADEPMPVLLEEARLYFSHQEFIKEGYANLIQYLVLIILQALCGLCTHVNEPDELNELPEFNVLITFLLAVHLADLLKEIKLSHVP
jgi:hypothetical protein